MNEITRIFSRALPFLPDPDELYELFRSKSRARVYFYLMKYSPASVVMIRKALRMDYTSAYKNIQWLKEKGFVTERGRIRKGQLKEAGYDCGKYRHTILWGIKEKDE
jgi:predicted transcriptional regulator